MIVFLCISPVNQNYKYTLWAIWTLGHFQAWMFLTLSNIKELLAWTKYTHKRFGEHQILRTFWLNVSVDILDRIKCALIECPYSNKLSLSVFQIYEFKNWVMCTAYKLLLGIYWHPRHKGLDSLMLPNFLVISHHNSKFQTLDLLLDKGQAHLDWGKWH